MLMLKEFRETSGLKIAKVAEHAARGNYATAHGCFASFSISRLLC